MGKIIIKNAVKRKQGYLYYIDEQGSLVETLMNRNHISKESIQEIPTIKNNIFFSNLNFTFNSKPSMVKYSDFIKGLLEYEREQFNKVFNKFTINEKVSKCLKKSKNGIQINFDSQYIKTSEGILFGSLCLRENGPMIFFPVKNIDSLYVNHKFSKENIYAQLMKTLIHELGHLYEENESKNRIFTEELLSRLDFTNFLNKKFSDLFYLKYVGQKNFNAMRKVGIKFLNDINEKNREKLKKMPGSSDWHVSKWLQQIEWIKKGKTGFYKTKKAERILNENLIIFDIEKDARDPDIFLIGAYNTSKDEFVQFFNPDDEKKLLREFLSYINKYSGHILVSYGGNRFDELTLMSGLERHRLPDFSHERMDIGIDMPNIIVGKLASSDYNLKSLAKFLGFEFKTNLNGFQVGLDLTSYKGGNKDINWEKIKLYNKDDVLATKYIIDKIKNNLN